MRNADSVHFQDPGLQALRTVGAEIAKIYPNIDPFTNLESSNYTNIALVYAGTMPACRAPSSTLSVDESQNAAWTGISRLLLIAIFERVLPLLAGHRQLAAYV